MPASLRRDRFRLDNNILIIVGALDGLSGFILAIRGCASDEPVVREPLLFGAFGHRT